jgi:uroporphyrin-III C-methyltransferase
MGLPHLISIVGAGPGDPDLLTVKALNRLQQADVVLYDALMGEEVLGLANPTAVKKYTGKIYNDGQNQRERQDAIHNEILHWALQGKRVVRLKAGDPMVFARGAEEIRFCRANNLNFEVIPGITAGLAASALFHIPVTERGKNNMVLFYTATREKGARNELDSVVQVVQSGSPVVVYMGVNNLPILAADLATKGVNKETPVLILSNISQAGQKSWSTTIGSATEFLQENKPETPSIIVIGKHAELV